MTLKDFLKEKKSAIVKRWLKDTLASYAKDAALFFRKNKDPFANPVGHALRIGTRAIFESLLEDKESDNIRRHLEGIIRIRAIQELSPSQAISFVLLLKKSIRKELGEKAGEPKLNSELITLETEIDRIALLAFDIYMQCREEFYELRVNEIKRNVSGIMRRFGENGFEMASEPIGDKIES